jgi:hypothetical protein
MKILALVFFPVVLFAQGLTGVIDFHVHSDPDSQPRSIDAIDLARLAKARGIRGLVLKNHYEPTASLAYVVRKEVPGIEVFGGVALDFTDGGINPDSVERMATTKGGWGRVVWMPTIDAANHVHFYKENRPSIPVVRNGAVTPEVKRVLAVIAKHDLIFETGHSAPEESLLLIRAARSFGIKRMVVTHALAPMDKMNLPQMQEAAKFGAYIELTYSSFLGPNDSQNTVEYVAAIRAVGPEHCILASDLGRADLPLHPDGLEAFFHVLREQGITEEEINRMSKTNPAMLLGLP